MMGTGQVETSLARAGVGFRQRHGRRPPPQPVTSVCAGSRRGAVSTSDTTIIHNHARVNGSDTEARRTTGVTLRKELATPADEKRIGRTLRELRQSRSMTQTELADTLNIKAGVPLGLERATVRKHGALIAAAKAPDFQADEVLGSDSRRRQRRHDRPAMVHLRQEIGDLPCRARDALLKTITNSGAGTS